MSSLTEKAKRAFAFYIYENTVRVFEKECADVILNIPRDRFDNETQKRKFMRFIEKTPYGEIVAALYACRRGKPGGMFYEWGKARLVTRLRSYYVEGDPHGEHIADFALSYIEEHMGRASMFYEQVEREVRKNEEFGSQARHIYHYCYKKIRKGLGFNGPG